MCIRDRYYTLGMAAVGAAGDTQLQLLELLGMDSVAVSYTHLDVYKRQPISIVWYGICR